MAIGEIIGLINSNPRETLDKLIKRLLSDGSGGGDGGDKPGLNSSNEPFFVTDIATFGEEGFISDDGMCIVMSASPLLRKHKLAFEIFYRHVMQRNVNLGLIMSNLFDIDLTKDSSTLAEVALPLANKQELLKIGRVLNDIMNDVNSSKRSFMIGASFYITQTVELRYQDYKNKQITLYEMEI
jgi:hypothetical protein